MINRRALFNGLAALAASPIIAPIVNVLLAPKVVNILDYGAVPDGITPCGHALQKAMAAVCEGGTIYLPPGHYNFSSVPVDVIGKNVIIQGSTDRPTVLV